MQGFSLTTSQRHFAQTPSAIGKGGSLWQGPLILNSATNNSEVCVAEAWMCCTVLGLRVPRMSSLNISFWSQLQLRCGVMVKGEV